MGRKGIKLVLATGEHAGVPNRFRAQVIEGGCLDSLGFLKAVPFCGSVRRAGVFVYGVGVLAVGPYCVEGQGLVRPSYPAQGRPMGGGRGFWNLINPSGMYVVLAIPIHRQRSGVQARACPGCGCGPWRGPHWAGLG